MIDAYLKRSAEVDDRTIHQLFAANRSERMPDLRRTLLAGTTVILDRYAYSGVAYTLAKGAPGLDLSFCKAADAGLLAPDLVLFLDIPAASAASRPGFGDERYETRDAAAAVRRAFALLAEDARADPAAPDWTVIDAARPREEVLKDVLKHATDVASA
ncbi:Thymidylate kinase, partial [Cladochytrium tenue]